jgi:8-oxo-dGTP diphosphatase
LDKGFNIRVYGVLINEKKEVLLMDETRFGVSFTKFPGGGLELGEGLEDCLIREFQEELGMSIKVLGLMYVNPFFVQSAFNPKDQLIAVYYTVYSSSFEMKIGSDTEQPKWFRLDTISEDDLTFPIDKEVVKLIKQKKRD